MLVYNSFIRFTERHFHCLDRIIGAFLDIDVDRHGVNVSAKNDMHEESLHEVANLHRHINLQSAVAAGPDLVEPLLMRLHVVLLEILKHDDEPVFEECMSEALSLCFPFLVCW